MVQPHRTKEVHGSFSFSRGLFCVMHVYVMCSLECQFVNRISSSASRSILSVHECTRSR